jgi:hypothetical protein
MKKTITYFFKMLFALLLMGWSGSVSAQYSGGDGSIGNPYQINTLTDLGNLSANSGDWASNFIQTADIDASATNSWDLGQGFLPIASGLSFDGNYDGQSHTISNLFIDRPSSFDVGLFAVASGTIKNLGLLNVSITGANFVGAIGGQVNVINNCFSTGAVNGGNNVGGIAGFVVTSNNSFSACNVTGLGDFVGGFVGTDGSDYITNCYSTGSVIGNASVGGFIGTLTGVIENCFSSGNVSGITDVGGLVGIGTGGNNCFWDMQTSGQAISSEGVGKTTAQMKMASTYLFDPSLVTPWDLTLAGNAWAFDGGYPFLRYESKTPANVWLGGSAAWDLAGNWSEGSVPVVANNVFVTNGGSFPLVSTANNASANLTIENGGVLTLASSGQLTVAGTLINNTGVTGLIVNSGGSLIENTAGVTATVERNFVGGEWHLISSPVSNSVSGMFLGKYLQELNEATNSYSDITTSAVPLTPAKGFAIFDAAGFTAQYAGPLNTADKTFNYTFSGSLPSEGYNLVGNPYPSSIDWDLVVKPGTLNHATYRHVNASTWATYNDGVGTPLSTEKYIAPGQGFLVQATGNGTLTFTNAAKAHNATEFYKNSNETLNNLVRLQVTGNGYSDEAVVRFLSDATAEFDGKYDAHKLYGTVNEAPQIYTIGSTPLAINALPETSSVPVGVHVGVTGSFTIAATEMKDLKYVTLEDIKTGVFTDLSVKPYTFNFTAGENEQRFVLHFSALAVNETESVSANVYSNNQTVYVNMKDQVKGDISIYDISGKLVTTKLGVQGMNEISIATTGNYIVKVITKGNTMVKKVFIN